MEQMQEWDAFGSEEKSLREIRLLKMEAENRALKNQLKIMEEKRRATPMNDSHKNGMVAENPFALSLNQSAIS